MDGIFVSPVSGYDNLSRRTQSNQCANVCNMLFLIEKEILRPGKSHFFVGRQGT